MTQGCEECRSRYALLKQFNYCPNCGMNMAKVWKDPKVKILGEDKYTAYDANVCVEVTPMSKSEFAALYALVNDNVDENPKADPAPSAFDIKARIQEQLEKLLACNDKFELRFINARLDALLAVYAFGVFDEVSK